MFRFLCVIYFLCNVLPGALSKSLIMNIDESQNFDTFGNHTSRCNWECVVVNKSNDFVTEMKAGLSKYRIVSLDLTLRQYVDDKCLNQTDSYSASKLADAWMWSTAVNTVTHEKNVFYRPGSNGSSVTSFSKSVQGEIKRKVACTFNLSMDPTTQQLHSSINDVIANVLMEEVEEFTWQSGAVLCYKEREQSTLYVCLTLNKSTSTASPKKSVEWPVRTLSAGGGFTILILVISLLFFPVVLCLFSPTHVCSIQNIDSIVLEGPSHISIRGLVANFVTEVSLKSLGSRKRFLIWLHTSLAILCLPLGLHPSSFAYSYLDKFVINPGNVTFKVMLTIGFLCGILGLMRVCFTQMSFEEHCFVCHYFIGEKTFHHDQASELEDEIKQHLRIQPLIIPKCWYLFSNYFKDFNMYLSKWDDGESTHGRWTTFCQFLGLKLLRMIALIAGSLVLLVTCLVLILAFVFYSCPMSTIFDFYISLFITNGDNRPLMATRVGLLTAQLILPYAGGVSLFLLLLTSLFIKALATILSLENIPLVTLLVISTFYCTKCYYSFTQKYDDIAAKLYSFLKTRVQQDNNQQPLNLKHNKNNAIPKPLFDEACQKTTPLAENVCKLLLRICIISVSSFLIYTIVTETPGVPERMKNTATFFVAVMPMIVEILVLKKGDKMKELKQEELDEKIQSIANKYYDNQGWIQLPKSK